MYESKKHRPIPRHHFYRRLLAQMGIAALLVAGSLLLGMAGYSHYENLPWRDGFLNAAMLLGGMGPVNAPQTNGGKIFAGMYALYAGLVFIIGAGVILAPVVHRILHLLAWEGDR